MDFVVFSHLRWDFVYQRPQHLLSRAARSRRVLFIEEAVPGDKPDMDVREPVDGVTVARPMVPEAFDEATTEHVLVGLTSALVHRWRCGPYAVWHYSVMAEPLSAGLDAAMTIFDSMDDLAAFRHAPPSLHVREERLLSRADIVFTGGWSLYERLADRHPDVHPFPSSVDVEHFATGRHETREPEPLAGIGHPRLVYAGVIDERLDLPLLQELAEAGVGEVVLIGPVAKLDEGELPQHPRLHYLGLQSYSSLPAFFANSEVGIMPFALNAATRSISPTKTPEYLAAGLPVVTTPIADVVRGYGDLPTVHVARDRREFVLSCVEATTGPRMHPAVDERLRASSWDATWDAMQRLIDRKRSRDRRP